MTNHSQIACSTTDILDRDDAQHLITQFYKQLMKDELIAFFFTEIKPIVLSEHIQTLTDFCELQIFNKRMYRGNTYQLHRQLHEKSALNTEHFQRWQALFIQTVDKEFSGEHAELAKKKAGMIADKMRDALAKTSGAAVT